jgi:hypothetical protein
LPFKNTSKHQETECPEEYFLINLIEEKFLASLKGANSKKKENNKKSI